MFSPSFEWNAVGRPVSASAPAAAWDCNPEGRANRSRICVLRESKPFKESFEEQRRFSGIRTNRQPSSFVAQGAATRFSLRGPGGFRWVPHSSLSRVRFFHGSAPGQPCTPLAGARERQRNGCRAEARRYMRGRPTWRHPLQRHARTPQGPLTPARPMWCIFGRRLGRPEGKPGTGRRDTMRRLCLALTQAAGIPVLAPAGFAQHETTSLRRMR